MEADIQTLKSGSSWPTNNILTDVWEEEEDNISTNINDAAHDTNDTNTNIATLNVTIDKKEALLDMAKSNIEKIDEVGDFLFTLMQKVENSTIWNTYAN